MYWHVLYCTVQDMFSKSSQTGQNMKNAFEILGRQDKSIFIGQEAAHVACITCLLCLRAVKIIKYVPRYPDPSVI